MNDQLPARQRAVLDAVRRSIQRRRKVPSILELAAELGVSGPTVHQHLKALERKGFLRREPGSPRNIELIGSPAEEPCQCTHVPLVGRVAAGEPILAQENIEGWVPVEPRSGGEVLFALRVQGESMIGAGIYDGDVVIVRQQETAEPGNIVVALVDEEDATVKRLGRVGKTVELRPENPSMKPIRVRADRVRIQGKVVGLRRELD